MTSQNVRLHRTLTVAVLLALCAPCSAADPKFEKAVHLYEARDYVRSYALFSEVIAQQPQNSSAYVYAGHCLLAQGKCADAKRIYLMVTERFKGSPAETQALRAISSIPSSSGTAGSPTRVSTASTGGQQHETNASDEPADLDLDYTLVHDHFLVPAKFNGNRIDAMFDTGAEHCVVAMHQLKALNISLPENAKTIVVSGAAGTGTMARLTQATVTVGTLTRSVPVIVLNDPRFKEPIIGQQFIKGYQFKIDNRQRQIHLSKGGESLQPRKVGVTKKGYSVPFTMSGNSLIVDVEINRKPAKMIFDTGAFDTCFALQHAMAVGMRLNSQANFSVGGADGTAPATFGTIERFEFGPIVKSNLRVVVVLRGGPSLPLLSPKLFVDDRNYVIDQENRVITFY